MNARTPHPWEPLFPPPAEGVACARLSLRLLRRRGLPFLLLPLSGNAARLALNLYPAQTAKARLARGALRVLSGFGLAPGAEHCELRLAPDAPLVRFLCPPATTPAQLSLAVLPGNPSAPGRRFVLLVFDARGRPVRVVKAGAGGLAAELVRREARRLRELTPERLRAPALQGELADGPLAALALDYAPGRTPRPGEQGPLPALLTAWLDDARTVRFDELPAARQLAEQCHPDDALRLAQRHLAGVNCHPAIHHGDFAPWNVRVGPDGRWRVLDWERAEAAGPPAWDWFHFFLQPLVLVRRLPPAAILAEFDRFRRAPEFAAYAAAAGVARQVDALWLGYLLHCRDVIRQEEGMPAIRALVELAVIRS